MSSRVAFDAFLLGVVGAVAVISVSYESRAGNIPLLVCAVAGVLLVVQGWVDLTGSRFGADGTSGDASDDEPIGWYGPTRTFAWVAGFIFLIWLVGYLIAVAVFCALSMVVIGRTSWKLALGVTAGLWVCLALLLEVVLDVGLLQP